HYIRALSDEEFLGKAAPFFAHAGVAIDDERRAMLRRAAPFLKERCATLQEAPDAAHFIMLTRPITLKGKDAKPLQRPGARDIVKVVRAALAEAGDWSDPGGLNAILKDVAEARGVNFGEVGQPLRAALTGGLPSPSLGEVLCSLGRAESLARLEDQAA
ncbi:MAG TPA: glutamate--tRNA ligase, partial [Parvularculaceae bacterium]|nr:glutamate--tRNA ligase [Parvularculaceae bacterium]